VIKSQLGSDLDATLHRVFPFLANSGWNPNVLSVLGAGVSLAAGVAFAMGAFLPAAALVVVGGFFDLVDGVVARAQGKSSRFGAFLDSSLDRVADVAVFTGLVIHYAAIGSVWAYLAGATLIAAVLVSYTKARAESELPGFKGGLLERAERVVVLLVGAIFGIMPLALGIVFVGSAITAGQRIALAHRGLEALDRGEPWVPPGATPEPNRATAEGAANEGEQGDDT
jgi:CDP-diacylglycerol--glycerol-3-phosphate 3-phosphatidyltransferase